MSPIFKLLPPDYRHIGAKRGNSRSHSVEVGGNALLRRHGAQAPVDVHSIGWSRFDVITATNF
jgi:hypothetical protein